MRMMSGSSGETKKALEVARPPGLPLLSFPVCAAPAVDETVERGQHQQRQQC